MVVPDKVISHRAIRHIERNTNRILMENMAGALLSNNSTDVHHGVDKLKPRVV